MLLAPECALCHRPLDTVTDGPVCGACWNRVSFITPPVCDACGDPLPSAQALVGNRPRCPRCASGSPYVDRARALGAYDGTLRDLIHTMKYDGRLSLACRLGELLARRGFDLIDGADGCVPVPLHWTRRWSRGFNQAAELARRLPLPLVPALVRTRRTGAQAALHADARAANVAGAFALAWRLSGRWPSGLRMRASSARDVRGSTLVLVDDVSTTGATLEACAKVLKEAGVREVRALTVARTLRARPRG